MEKRFELGFIGAGRMGSALAEGVLKAGMEAEKVCFFDIDGKRAEELKTRTGAELLGSAAEVFQNSRITFLCVKPDQTPDVLKELSEFEKESVLVSIAAGISTNSIRKYGGFRAVRAMPNTPALIGSGVTAVAKSPYVTEDEFESVVDVFRTVGEVVVVEEKHMNAVTALSGSGPAYVFRFIEALKEGGINLGLSAEISLKLAVETVLGAAKLLKSTDRSTSEMIEMVASPGGTTIAGLKKLEKHGFKYAVMEALEAAEERAKKLEKKNE
jgi:pyrroline-5-carboxylate reductase